MDWLKMAQQVTGKGNNLEALQGLSGLPKGDLYCRYCGNTIDAYSAEEVNARLHKKCAAILDNERAQKETAIKKTALQGTDDEALAWNDGEDFGAFQKKDK